MLSSEFTITKPPYRRRVLTLGEAAALTSDEIATLRLVGFIPPIAGGDGEGEGEGGGSGEGEGSAGGEGEGEGEGGGSGSGNGGGEGEGDDDDGDDDDVLEIRRGDYERLRQIAREKDAADRKRAKDEQDRKRKEAIEQGKFEEMLRDEAEQRAAVEAERDSAKADLAATLRKHRVEAVAKRLGFKDPTDALLYITDEDGDDDAAAERSLKKVIKKKPYLIDTRRPSGMPIGGINGSLLTMEQIQNMSEAEINENWVEVQKTMAAQGG